MDEIDKATAPPKPEEEDEEEEEFRPCCPEKAEDEGFLTQQGLKKKVLRLGEGWLVPEPGDEITGISIDHPFLSSILLSGSFRFLSSDMSFCITWWVFVYFSIYMQIQLLSRYVLFFFIFWFICWEN